MPTKLGGKALATKLVTDDELTTYKLEGGFVATPVYGVSDGSPTEGGNLLPIYVIEATDLKENGGRYVLAKGTPVPINTYITNRDVVRDRAMPVYVVGGVVNSGEDPVVGDYLVEDLFTTSRNAGSVNGTAADPGPGTRVVVDTNSKLSITGGNLSFATGGGGIGDPGLWYNTSFLRDVGIIGFVQVTYSAGGVEAGFDAGQSGAISDCLRLTGTSVLIRSNGGSLVSVGTVAASTAYTVVLATRNNGYYYFIRGGAFTNWTLLWKSSVVTGSGRYLAYIVTGSTGVATSDYARVPSDRWLPSPLVSDGFSAWGTSDGLGHAEGIAGGLGSGGNGDTWAQNTGTWTVSGGFANASALSGGLAVASVDTTKASVIVTTKVTRTAGDAGVVLRYADANNYVRAIHNGTNVQLVKVVSGTPTTLINTAATYVAGAEIRVICDGTAFLVYYNNVQIGSQQTINDAALASGTKQGLYTTNTGNTFDDFTVYARGTSNEYVDLQAYEFLIAPSSLQVTTSTTSTMTVTWTDNSNDETGFEVYRSTDPVNNFSLVTTTAANATSHQSTGLLDDTRYYFKVRAVNGAGNSAYSGTANGYTKLSPPTGLSVGSPSQTTLTLSWTDNSDTETGFKIERSTDNSSWSQIHTTAANATSYQDTGLTGNTLYYYRIRAYSNNQDSDYTSSANGTTSDYADPGTFEYWYPANQVLGIPPNTYKAGTVAGSFEHWQNGELV